MENLSVVGTLAPIAPIASAWDVADKIEQDGTGPS